ncbi:hypothetical protein X566_13540 [Afipia sp. P52-10]|nr:hypothetical protein X566_13540 [Afipia sp. P52-10]
MSPGNPLGDAPVPIDPGVDVFGTPATGGAPVGAGDDRPEPVVPGTEEPAGGTVAPGIVPGEPTPGVVPVPGVAGETLGLGVAPRLDPAGPVVPPAVCAWAWPANAISMTVAKQIIRMGSLLPMIQQRKQRAVPSRTSRARGRHDLVQRRYALSS